MVRLVALASLIALVACSDDGDATPRLLDGSPAATRALLGSYVIGGDSAFGLARLMRHTGDAWLTAAEVSPFGSRAQLFAGDVMIAASEATLYRLEGTTWAAQAIPAATTAVTLIGVEGDVIYGAAPDLDGGAIVTWAPQTALWREVAGSRPMGTGARAFLIEPGRVTWSDPARGIVRAEAGVQTVLVDCTAEPLGACATPLQPLFTGPNGDLALIACGHDAPPSAAFRMHGGALVPIDLPAGLPACAAATSVPGQAVLATLPPEGGDGVLLQLDAKATAWTRVAVASPGLTYVPAGDVIYGYGDGISARGIYVLDP